VAVGGVRSTNNTQPPGSPPTDRARAPKTLNATKTIGIGTRLYDGVEAAASQFSGPGQHNIVLLSDGGDTISTGTEPQAIAAAKKAGAQIFAVSLETEASEPKVLTALAKGTNGSFSSTSAADLQRIYQGLAQEISDQYVVTYRSTAAPGSQIDLSVEAAGASDSSVLIAPKGHVVPPAHSPTPVEESSPLLSGTIGLLVVIALAFAAL